MKSDKLVARGTFTMRGKMFAAGDVVTIEMCGDSAELFASLSKSRLAELIIPSKVEAVVSPKTAKTASKKAKAKKSSDKDDS